MLEDLGQLDARISPLGDEIDDIDEEDTNADSGVEELPDPVKVNGIASNGDTEHHRNISVLT